MKHEKTSGIVLTRTNFGEADRIITVITPDQGKLRLMAKGVRKEKSKLAGGIELFSVSQLSFIRGKRDISTLVSSRLEHHFGNIVKDINRTMLGYELLKLAHSYTPDDSEPVYFDLLAQALSGLDEQDIPSSLVKAWFILRLLEASGHGLNLTTDQSGASLQAGRHYQFDYDHMAFFSKSHGPYTDQHIKLLRLLLQRSLISLQTIDNVGQLSDELASMLQGCLELSNQ